MHDILASFLQGPILVTDTAFKLHCEERLPHCITVYVTLPLEQSHIPLSSFFLKYIFMNRGLTDCIRPVRSHDGLHDSARAVRGKIRLTEKKGRKGAVLYILELDYREGRVRHYKPVKDHLQLPEDGGPGKDDKWLHFIARSKNFTNL